MGFLGFLDSVEGLTKKYIASWDLNNEHNWLDGQVPCSGKPAKIVERQDFQIFLSDDMSMQSLEFLADTELILGQEKTISFSDAKDSACKTTEDESIFEVHAKGYWWDPDSWECQGGRDFECNSAVPDILRVPCERDFVVLPNDTEVLYTITFTPPTPTVAHFKMGTKNMTTSQFYSHIRAASGRERYKRKGSSRDQSRSFLFVEGDDSCTDSTGCLCHSSSPEREICKHMKNKCPRTPCSKPIAMEGFCCPICGVDIAITHDGSLSLKVVEELLPDVTSSLPKEQRIDGFAAKMPDGLMHVFFVPISPEADLHLATTVFNKLFDESVNSGGAYETSSLIAEGPFETTSENKGVKSAVTWILVLFSLSFVGAVLYAIYKKRSLHANLFSFRRMSSGGQISMRRTSMPPSIHITSVETAEGRSFTNPTFLKDTQRISPSENFEISSVSPTAEGGHQRENPVYRLTEGAGISFRNLQSISEDVIAEVKSDEVVVAEEIIIDVEPEIEKDTSDDDGIDPLEELARSRVENVISFNKNEEAEKIEEVEPSSGEEASSEANKPPFPLVEETSQVEEEINLVDATEAPSTEQNIFDDFNLEFDA